MYDPVMLSACFSKIVMIKLLLVHGGKINACDNAGMAPKGYAQKPGQKNG